MANGTGKKKGKKGLIIGLVLLVIVIAAGAVVGLAFAGKINIPGLTPKKKPIPPAAATKADTKPKTTPPPKKPDPPVDDTPAPTTKVVDKVGAQKLAEVWNEMPTDKLEKVVDKWKPDDLAVVLNEMDSEKAAALLAVLKPDKASKVSQELRQVASQVPLDAE